MARTPFEQGASDASRAVEQTRRLGITKEIALHHFLHHEESGGVQGALNAANNTYEDSAAEVKEQYALGWLAALVHFKQS